MEKICIKYKSYDLLRIIPFKANSDYDFKISFLDNKYQLRIHPENKAYFEIINNFDLSQWEISYHAKKAEKPTKFHIKSKAKPYRYYDLPIKNIIDPSSSPVFPIPFFKIGISKRDIFKKFKKKEHYKVIDLDNSNVVEAYLVSSNFDLNDFINKWDIFDLIYTMAPMEHFVNGKIQKGFFSPKLATINNNDVYQFRSLHKINKDITILINSFQDDNIDGKKQKSFFSIYENGNYLKYLINTPIQYKYSDKEYSAKKKAYFVQLDRNYQEMKKEEYFHWKEYFEEISINSKLIENEIDGFIIPQI